MKSMNIFARPLFAILPPRAYFSSSIKSAFRLEPIGQALPTHETPYVSGQLILHRHFGYRGIILNSWSSNLFEKNLAFGNDMNIADDRTVEHDGGRAVNVYAVLTDKRDIDLCASSLKPGITFLPEDCGRMSTIYVVPGMDYALHDDLIPYSCKSSLPIKNDYFDEFMHYDPETEPHHLPRDNLRRWMEARWSSLEVKTIRRETTEGIRVTAIPFLMGRRKIRWRYLIRIENLTNNNVQLRERFWKVFSINGNLESVTGKGVVGVQPFLTPESPMFQYHSHIQVPVAWAHMWGIFRFDRSSGGTIDVKIPAFPLCDKDSKPLTSTPEDNNANEGGSPGGDSV